jgi:homoserine dehydrogenase
VRGIDQLSALDLSEGESLGYVCKLLAVGRRVGESLSLSVEPVFVHAEDLLASVHGPFNAVSVSGDAIGHAMFYGPGAGGWPTAGAVVADVIKVARTVLDGHSMVNQNGWDLLPEASYVSADELSGRYYGRFMVKDQPGAVADITRVLGEAMISLAALNQHEPPGGSGDQVVPVIILTHNAKGGAVRRAMEQIAMLPSVVDQPVLIRIEELPHGPGAASE